MSTIEKLVIAAIGLFVLIIIIVAALIFNIFFTARDAQLAQAALAYVNCVQREYGMTPIRWYEEHGEYPLCGN